MFYIDASEILRFPSEIKIGVYISELRIFILLWHHSTKCINVTTIKTEKYSITANGGCRGHDCMVVVFIITYAISAYHH